MDLIQFKNLPDTSTPLNADNLNHNFNELKNGIDGLNELIKDSQIKASSLDSCLDSSKTDITIKKSGNIITIGGVLYFNSIPSTWQSIIQIPQNFYGSNGYGSLVEEGTGLVRPIIINSEGQIMMTASLSNSNIYAYINATIIL